MYWRKFGVRFSADPKRCRNEKPLSRELETLGVSASGFPPAAASKSFCLVLLCQIEPVERAVVHSVYSRKWAVVMRARPWAAWSTISRPAGGHFRDVNQVERLRGHARVTWWWRYARRQEPWLAAIVKWLDTGVPVGG